jgi:hypothetical protein
MMEQSDQKRERDEKIPQDKPKNARYSKEVDQDIKDTIAAYDGKPFHIAEQIARKWNLRKAQVVSRVSNLKNDKPIKTFPTFSSGNPIDYWEKIDAEKIEMEKPLKTFYELEVDELKVDKEKAKGPLIIKDEKTIAKDLLKVDADNYIAGTGTLMTKSLRMALTYFTNH